jgi:hypothetical protein
MDRTVLHVDLNNFYANVECLVRPEIRDNQWGGTGRGRAVNHRV